MTNYDSVKYDKTFLNQVILRLDFQQFADNNIVFSGDIEKTILKFFPKRGMDQLIRFNTFDVVFDPDNPATHNTRGTFMEGVQREYMTLSLKNKLVLSNKFLIIEIQEYSEFEEIQQWFHNIIIPFFAKSRITVTRTGLRYINILTEDRVRIRKSLFSPEIAATISANTFQDNNGIVLSRSMHMTEYQMEGMHLNFRYGLYNPNYPNELSNYSFALDYDCFTEELVDNSNNLLRYIEQGHNTIQMLFEASITDACRKEMRNE